MRSTLSRLLEITLLSCISLALGYGIGTWGPLRGGDSSPPEVDSGSRRAAVAEIAPGASSSSSFADSMEIADLRAEVASLKEQVAALASASGSIRDDLRRELASLQAERAADDEPPYGPAEQANAERTRRQVVAETEEAFWKEPADTPWSREASSAVLDALESDEGSKIEVLSLECRTETCRVEVVQDEAGETTRMLPLLLHRLGPTLPSVTTSEAEYPDGRRGMVLYMSARSDDSTNG